MLHRSCTVFAQVVERFGATDGCSAIPNSWLNEEVDLLNILIAITLDNTCTADSHDNEDIADDDNDEDVDDNERNYDDADDCEQACIIHDLCYSTIGANRTICDRFFSLTVATKSTEQPAGSCART